MDGSDTVETVSSRSNLGESAPKKFEKHLVTLGTVQLHDHDTNQIIPIPTPSDDPNDPLNWSRSYKYYITALVCFALLVCNAAAAGPTIAIFETAKAFFPNLTVDSAIYRVSYFFSLTALTQGLGNFIWVPLGNKFGRRPVYIFSYSIFLIFSLWTVFEHRYANFVVARVLVGFGSGAAECLAPLTIADIFFLHERGKITAIYTGFLSVGVSFGIVVSGLVTIHYPWRDIYKGLTVVIAIVLVLAVFTFPETAFSRDYDGTTQMSTRDRDDHSQISSAANPPRSAGKAKPYLHGLKLFRGTLTKESMTKMILRPLGLIILPPVLWAALVESVTIGFLVAVTTNVPSAYESTYNFETYQIGLTYFSSVIGALIGIPAGGQLGDVVADYLTRCNGGVRNPEMRLPAMVLSLFTCPLALILYGVGIQNKLPWICPTIGAALLAFSITQATNICLVYVIDAYRPIAGEVTVTVLGFKSIFGFALAFYTNPWVDEVGYVQSFGAMAGISAFVLLFFIPLYLWGKPLRHRTWNWWLVSFIHWEDDREVGE
ncbi:MFS general substrate transporter [Xylariaceae sp. FL0255]|nr:MFS general substrate transporter [Xylariaceae sp. FL0255]